MDRSDRAAGFRFVIRDRGRTVQCRVRNVLAARPAPITQSPTSHRNESSAVPSLGGLTNETSEPRRRPGQSPVAEF
jgi:hypothetical protein